MHFGNKNKQNHNFNSVSSLNNAGSNVHYCISNLADIKEIFLSCTVIFLSHNLRDGLFIFFIGVIDTHLSSFHEHNYRNGYFNYHFSTFKNNLPNYCMTRNTRLQNIWLSSSRYVWPMNDCIYYLLVLEYLLFFGTIVMSNSCINIVLFQWIYMLMT